MNATCWDALLTCFRFMHLLPRDFFVMRPGSLYLLPDKWVYLASNRLGPTHMFNRADKQHFRQSQLSSHLKVFHPVIATFPLWRASLPLPPYVDQSPTDHPYLLHVPLWIYSNYRLLHLTKPSREHRPLLYVCRSPQASCQGECKRTLPPSQQRRGKTKRHWTGTIWTTLTTTLHFMFTLSRKSYFDLLCLILFLCLKINLLPIIFDSCFSLL